MQINSQLVASIHYTLKDDKENLIDTSEGQEPLEYLHGAQNIVPGLEKALDGKSIGDKLSVVVEPKDAYGEYDVNLIQEIPKDMFGGVDEILPGMEFHAETEKGMQVVMVKEVNETTITVDGNMPLAGQTLHFDIEVVNVREATADELEHGHVHGPGCEH